MGEGGNADNGRVYVYAIGAADMRLPDGLAGLGGAPVRLCPVGRLAAVISDTALDVVRPERRHLSAHQGVLARLVAEADLLPMAFGMISDDEATVRGLLAEHVAVLSRQLARIAGRVEMTVRLRWQEDDTFRVFVERFPELRRRRDACFGGQREPAQVELLELGRTFEQLLQRERKDKTSLALGMLGQVAAEVKTVEPSNERLMFDLNCLVGRDHEGRFETAVEELAGKLGDEFVLEVRGPWPPYNFVNVAL
jgi:hypothetical protein